MKTIVLGIAPLLVAATCVHAAEPIPLSERQARPAPEWVTRGIMYQIQPRAFTPEGTRREDQLKAFDLDYGWGFQWDNAAGVRRQWEKMRDQRPRGGARFIRFIDNHDIANAETPPGQARLAFRKQLCTMRRTQRALTHGAVVWLDNDQPDAVLSFLRRTSDGEILSLVNLSDRALDVRIAVPEATSWPLDTLIADGAQAAEDDGGLRLALDGLGYLVAKRQ